MKVERPTSTVPFFFLCLHWRKGRERSGEAEGELVFFLEEEREAEEERTCCCTFSTE